MTRSHAWLLGAVAALLVPFGNLPAPAPAFPVAAYPPAAVSLAAGSSHTLAIAEDGVPYGTGSNLGGQLTRSGYARYSLTALAGLPEGVRAAEVAGGYEHSLVVGDDGRAYGAGANVMGQLTGTRPTKRSLAPLKGLPEGVAAVAVAAGGDHSLVVGSDGTVYGTGSNRRGQLTGSESTRVLTPLSGLPAGVRAVSVAASGHTLVLGDDGAVYGTGDNTQGQLTGSGKVRRTLTPLAGLPPGVHALAIAAGDYHSLVVGDDGVVYGAGLNGSGQLTGSVSPVRTLTPLAGLPVGVTAVAVAAGGYHSLVIGDDGRVYGTGNNRHGALTRQAKPKRTLTVLSGLPPGVGAVALAAGNYSSLVLGDDARIYGTGWNGLGQLTGTESKKTSLTPLLWTITNTVAPRITGEPRVGGRLTARHGQWVPTPESFTYVWLRTGRPIPGATSRTYRPVDADHNLHISVKVTASYPGYAPAVKTSAPTPPISD